MPDTLKGTINRLIPQKRGKGRLPAADDREPIGSSRSVGRRATGGGSGGGIAPPLTEQAGKRKLHPATSLVSADGFFVLTYQPIKSTEFQDGDGNTIETTYVNE